MLLSRTTVFLIFCFSFNTVVAEDNAATNALGYATSAHESYSDQLRPRKRGQTQTTLLPSAWAINANESGTLCYIDPEDVLLWREDATFASRLSIKPQASNKPLNLRWAKNQDTLKWPNERVKLVSNNTYYVKLSHHNAASQVITTKQLPEQLWDADKAEQMNWMQDNGCISQAEYLQQTITQ
jgi:hypothetical protein